MNFSLLLLAIVLLGIAIFAFRQGSKKGKQDAAPAPRRDPFADATGPEVKFSPRSLGPGAILSYGNIDYVVRGTLTLTQGPYTWYEHMLDGGNGAQWLSVEVDEGQLELIMWQTQHGPVPQPVDRIESQGSTYAETERGVANFSSEGNTGLPSIGECHYIDYIGSGATSTEHRAGLEAFNGAPWEFSTGKVVLPGEFTVYPAPSNPAN